MTIDSAPVPENAATPAPALPATLPSPQKLARWTLTAFLLTFVCSRVVVLLIMTRRMPDLYFYAGQTHVHHLNYGIFLLVLVAGWGVFARPRGAPWLKKMAMLYGIGLALTFDEFGMWLHLGGGYWQRASYDAIVWVAAALGLIIVAPDARHWRPLHWAMAIAILCISVFALKLMSEELNLWQPFLQQIEQLAPQ